MGRRKIHAHLIMGDIHCPRHSLSAMSLVFKILDNFEFLGVGSIGDLGDFGAASRHTPSGRQIQYTLGSELAATLKLAKNLAEATPKSTETWITMGNHDDWLRRWLVKHPEISNDPNWEYARQLESYGWDVTAYQQVKYLCPYLVATHDFGMSGRTAFLRGTHAMGESVVSGHTHAAGIYWVGSALGPMHVSMNVGCLADPDQIDYKHASRARYENIPGVGLVHLGPEHCFSVEFSPFFQFKDKLCTRLLDDWVAVDPNDPDERAADEPLDELREQDLDVRRI